MKGSISCNWLFGLWSLFMLLSSCQQSASSQSSPQSSATATGTIYEICSIPTNFPEVPFDDGTGNSISNDTDASPGRRRRRAQESSSASPPVVTDLAQASTRKPPIKKLGQCLLPQPVLTPQYWKPYKVAGTANNAPNFYLPVLSNLIKDPKAAPTYTTVSAGALQTAAPGGTPYVFGGNVGYRVNVDHVYFDGISDETIDEVSILQKFFAANLMRQADCPDFNSVFWALNDSSQRYFLSEVFDVLPGNKYGGLAGMSENLNSIKAYFFNPRRLKSLDKPQVCDMVSNLNLAAITMDMLHSEELTGFFVRSNTRIYQALQVIDIAAAKAQKQSNNTAGAVSDTVAASPPPDSTCPTTSWSLAYKTWLGQFLIARDTENRAWAVKTQEKLSGLLNNESPDKRDTASTQSAFNTYMASKYAKAEFWSFNFTLQWPDHPELIGCNGISNLGEIAFENNSTSTDDGTNDDQTDDGTVLSAGTNNTNVAVSNTAATATATATATAITVPPPMNTSSTQVAGTNMTREPRLLLAVPETG